MQKGKKRSSYERGEIQDDQVYEQIKDQVRQIRESRLSQVQKIERIDKLYSDHKQSKRRRKMLERGTDKNYSAYENKKQDVDSQSEQPGEINETMPKRKERETHEEQLTKQELGELIKLVTLTRKRLVEFLDNRRFNDLVKGCFVRYKCDSTSKEEYMIAQIIDVKQGTKEYTLTLKHKTRILLVIQESSIKIVELPIEMVSNQAISGSMQINRWIEQNGDKIPKERQIKEKLEQHTRLLSEQLSSQEIDKNILNRAIRMAKGQQQITSLQDLQNLLDFIIEKYENYEVMEEQEVAKRKEDKLQLMNIRRKKHEYHEILKSLEEKKKSYLESKGLTNQNVKAKEKNQKVGQGLKIEEKREDEIKQKWKLREMMLCTAEGYEKIRMNLLENHAKFEIQLDV